MRDYDHDAENNHRPKGDPIERDEDTDLRYRGAAAAAARRADVLDRAALLGLQRSAGNAGVSALVDEELSPVRDIVGSGGGSPLDPATRADMESRFGRDFADVRVHVGDAAHESARSVNARAYTVGSDIVFQHGRYDPSSSEGRHTLAHELTHVVQQRSGPVDGTDAGGGMKVSDPTDRFEREAAANADAVVQRQEEPAEDEGAEETAQTFVQRLEGDEEAEPA